MEIDRNSRKSMRRHRRKKKQERIAALNIAEGSNERTGMRP